MTLRTARQFVTLLLTLCIRTGPAALEAEPSFGGPTDTAELSTGRDVAMAGSAPADAELLDDADTETAAAAAERSASVSDSLSFSCLCLSLAHPSHG